MSAVVDPTIKKALLMVWLSGVVQQQIFEPSPPQFSCVPQLVVQCLCVGRTRKKWSNASGELFVLASQICP